MEIDLNLITSHMDELKDTEARLKFELNNVQKEIEKEELKLTALIEQEGVNSMDYGIYTFGWKYSKRKSFDQKLFGIEHPELYEQYKTEKEIKSFDFKINK